MNIDARNNLSLPSRVRVLFFGADALAVPTLDALIKNGYPVVGVVTNPDKPAGRSLKLTPPPVKIAAGRHQLPVFQPLKLTPDLWKEKIPEAELFVVCAYGKIIPKAILEMAPRGSLNIHPSLLPRWRGPSPIQYMILHGDQEIGITIILMDELMDHGPIVAKSKINPRLNRGQKSKITFFELHNELSTRGANLLIETLPRWLDGEITPVPQDESKATYSKILKKEDGRIEWSRSAHQIERMIRAFTPWPGAWTMWSSQKKIWRMKVDSADVSAEQESPGLPGSVWRHHRTMMIKTGSGSLAIKKITPEGKRPMEGDAFLRGHPEIIGTVLR